MPKPLAPRPLNASMNILSRLLLSPRKGDSAELYAEITDISREKFDDLVALAHSNHVIVRGLEVFLGRMRDTRDDTRAEWATTALAAERARIKKAVSFLHEICAAFEDEGHDITVIKSLDHWPDLGSDLDLYTNTKPEVVCQFMTSRFEAQIATRSWGDRLACKWNFVIPELPEAVEIHMGRLGQTGEQVAIASSLPGRARLVHIGDHTFRVPAASDRLMISTLQRMYRHFYFRLCDIVDSGELAESGILDYEDLRRAANAASIWPGVATYLAIVSDYVKQYRGFGIDLPEFVKASARFGGEEIYFGKDFLRVPDYAAIRQPLRIATYRFAAQAGITQQRAARLITLAGHCGYC